MLILLVVTAKHHNLSPNARWGLLLLVVVACILAAIRGGAL